MHPCPSSSFRISFGGGIIPDQNVFFIMNLNVVATRALDGF